MKTFIRTALLAVMLLASGSVIDAQVSFGIRIWAHLHNLAWFGFCRHGQGLSSCGWTDIGIPREGVTNGMTAIGLDRPMRELVGSDRTTMASSFLRATGTETEVTYHTIIGGTTIEATATTIGITGTIGIKTITKAVTAIVTDRCQS